MTTQTQVVAAKTSKQEKIEELKSVFAVAATNEKVIKEENAAKLETADDAESKSAFKKHMQRAATHERYNEALSEMSEKALALLSKYKVDATQLAAQSRECKKRSIKILEALAANQRVDDKALDAVLNFIVAKDAYVMTLEQVRHEMQHETTTQAQYFKICAIFFNFAQYSKAEKTITLNKDAHVLRDLLKIYTVAA